MQRLMIIAVGLGLVCFGCSSDKSNDKKKSDDKSSETKKSDDKVAVDDKPTGKDDTGCKSDKDCKGYRVCDNGKCAEPKKPTFDPKPGLVAPAAGTTGGTTDCKAFVDEICQSCGSSSTICSTMRSVMGVVSGGATAAMTGQLCKRLAPQLDMLKAIPAGQRAMACIMIEKLLKGAASAKPPTVTTPPPTTATPPKQPTK